MLWKIPYYYVQWKIWNKSVIQDGPCCFKRMKGRMWLCSKSVIIRLKNSWILLLENIQRIIISTLLWWLFHIFLWDPFGAWCAHLPFLISICNLRYWAFWRLIVKILSFYCGIYLKIFQFAFYIEIYSYIWSTGILNLMMFNSSDNFLERL